MPDMRKFQKLCRKTAKKFSDPDKEIMTWGLGAAGEAGDLAGCIKKTISHNNDQTAGIRENIGDTIWYLAMIANFYDWELSDILDENIDKLQKRFGHAGFTDEKAGRGGTRTDWNK